jgi:AcrR family transcriptional regulator
VAPTGLALPDARQQLFDAAERVLLRSGPSRLTSRDITDEAGCAKGVLHRYFSNFDSFLAEFVIDRTRWLDTQAVLLAGSAGLGDIVDTIVDGLQQMLDPTRLRIVCLVTYRDGVRELLRERWLTGIPVLSDTAYAISGYLRAERDAGRLDHRLAPDTLGPAIVGLAYQSLIDAGDPHQTRNLRRDVAALLGQPN